MGVRGRVNEGINPGHVKFSPTDVTERRGSK